MARKPSSGPSNKTATPENVSPAPGVGRAVVMPFQPMQSMPGAQGMPPPQPTPTFNAGHVLIASGANEFSVMFGQTGLLPMQQPGGGQILATPLVEWFATITLSP